MTNSEQRLLEQATSRIFQYDNWRSRFLNYILRSMTFLGILLLAANFSIFKNFELIAYICIYILLLIAAFAPIPYIFKAGTLISAGYFIGTYTLFQFGPWANGVIYYLAITLFACLLFEERIETWIFALCLTTIGLVSSTSLSGIFPLTSTIIPETRIADWVSYAADYIVFAISLIWAIRLLKSEFRTVADQFQSALNYLSKDRSELEKLVEERNIGLLKKTEQLRAASFISHQTAALQDLQSLLNAVVDLVTDQFGFYHAGIFIVNESGETAILQAASSEGGKTMIEKGHSLQVGTQGIVGYTASQKKPRIALDVGTDAVYFNNPDLPKTRSEVALPLIIRNKVIGVLDIQSDQPSAFNLEDIDVLQTLADQVAVGIENSRLLNDTQTTLNQLEILTSTRTRESWKRLTQNGKYAYTYTPLGLQNAKAIARPSDKSSMDIPITLKGQAIGTISISRKDNNSWSDVEKELISEVASQTGLAVDNLRLVEEATERARQEQTVGELAFRFSQSSDIDSLLQTAARELGQVSDVTEVSVYIGDIPEQSTQKRRTKRTLG